MVIEIIQKEIATRGVGYIILRDCPEDRLGEGLGRGMEKLKRAGAKTVLAASLPEGEPLNPGPVGVWRLTHVHDMVDMERPLADRPKTDVKLTLKPLKKAADDKLYAELTNRAFSEVPNARTVSPNDPRIPNCRRGIAWLGDRPVGTYELDLSEKDPVLSSLAVEPELWRQGYGRSLLRALLAGMPKAEKCALTVSSLNIPALELYQSEGFTQVGVRSSWFEVV